jgi:hypothetical protein
MNVTQRFKKFLFLQHTKIEIIDIYILSNFCDSYSIKLQDKRCV